MRSFLREMEEKFVAIENSEYCDACDRVKSQCICEEDLEEQNVSSAVAGYNTPGAFLTPAQYEKKKKKIKYESVNKPATFKWKDESPQRPESDEEVFNDKFPFATSHDYWWQSDNNEYPTKFYADGMGTNSIKDKTIRIGNLPDSSTPIRQPKNEYLQVQEAMDRKYEELIESYRRFSTEDKNLSPEKKVKNTIKDLAKKLQEIETLVNYNTRLKTESGISASTYGSSTQKALTKISERLIKISERVRALGE